MNPHQDIDAIVSRMTPEQYAMLVSFGERLLDISRQPPDIEEESLSFRLRTLISTPLRERLRVLTRKSEAELLSDAERVECLRVAEQIEAEQATRLESAMRLAELRGISVSDVLKEFGIVVHD